MDRRFHSIRWLGVPLACCLAAIAHAQQAHAQQAPATPTADTAATPPARTTDTRHRSAFGEAMSRLTGALREAGRQRGDAAQRATTMGGAPPASIAAPAAGTVASTSAPQRLPAATGEADTERAAIADSTP